MVDADAAVEFRVLIKHGPDVVHDRVYILDFDAPNWEQFDLTPSEQQRCKALLSAAREIWVDDRDRHTPSDHPSEPVRALLDAMIAVIGDALKRTVESRAPLRSWATAV